MALWRKHVRLTGCVALFALALQLACAFGHFHHEWTAATGSAAIATASDDDAGHHHGTGADHCVVCTAVSLANAFALPTPPQLPALAIPGATTVEVRADDLTTVTRFRAFNSRAPPHA